MNMLLVRVGASLRWNLVGGLVAVAVAWGGVGCGGGGDSDPGGTFNAAQAPQAGEVPPTLTLAQPRMVNFTNHLALAWTSEAAFSGSIVAQIELGLSFAPFTTYTLSTTARASSTKKAPACRPVAWPISSFVMPTASS